MRIIGSWVYSLTNDTPIDSSCKFYCEVRTCFKTTPSYSSFATQLGRNAKSLFRIRSYWDSLIVNKLCTSSDFEDEVCFYWGRVVTPGFSRYVIYLFYY